MFDQVKALAAGVGVRVNVLDVAGSNAVILSFEGTPLGESNADDKQAAGALPSACLPLWLIHRPGHYEVVYPAAGCEHLDSL